MTTRHDTCRVCAGPSNFQFTQNLLAHPVDYFDCPRCGYVQTQTPDWLEQAYARAINDVDTGIMLRNRLNVGRVLGTLWAYGQLHGRVTDHAGGYGILVRLLRDAGVDARWRDKYCENLLARGFEADEGQSSDLLSAFEVFEHLVHPLEELRSMVAESPIVLLSTELVPTIGPPAKDWWYLGPEHGQHIGFFRSKTLRWMADELGCHHASDGVSVHVFSRRPAPRLWRTAMRRPLLLPLVTRYFLRSRTNRDFDFMRRKSRTE